jgi:hypothetical protein
MFGYLVVAALAEAAARTGEMTLVQAAPDWLSERTRVTPTGWVLGIEASVRALSAPALLVGAREAAWSGWPR